MTERNTGIHRRVFGKRLGITYGGGKGVGLRIVPVYLVQGVGKELTGTQIHRGRKAGIGTCLGILRMRNTNVIVARSTVIIKTSLAGHQIFITDIDIAAVFVTFGVNGPSLKPVTTVGIVIPRNTEIYIIADGKIVPSVLNKIPPSGIVTKGREQNTGHSARGQWEIGKRHGNGRGHIYNVHITVPGNDFLFGYKFGLSHTDVIIGVHRIVGGGQFTLVQKVNRVVLFFGLFGIHLHGVASQLPQTGLLLRPRVPYQCFLGVKIKTDGIRPHLIVALLKKGKLGVVAQGVLHTAGIDFIFYVIHNDNASLKFGILVVDFRFVVQVNFVVLLAELDIILGLIFDFVQQQRLFFWHGICACGVGSNGIV